jgi:hypothetical protein
VCGRSDGLAVARNTYHTQLERNEGAAVRLSLFVCRCMHASFIARRRRPSAHAPLARPIAGFNPTTNWRSDAISRDSNAPDVFVVSGRRRRIKCVCKFLCRLVNSSRSVFGAGRGRRKRTHDDDRSLRHVTSRSARVPLPRVKWIFRSW